MNDDLQTPAVKKPPRKVTLREMRERIADEAYRYRAHQDMMVRLVAEVGKPFAENPEEYAIAEAFESAARVIDWILRDDVVLQRLKQAAERGEV